MTTGPIAAVTYAAGEQLNLLAGVRLTRLAQAALPGDSELVVERSLGMDPTGTVSVDGVTYGYSALIDGALQGLSVVTPQGTTQGVFQAHALNAVVTDANRSYSALDAVRQSFFVDTAQGDDLSLLGRILGVPRDPAVADDTQYRNIIKAISYSPRTTLQALTNALNALVGPGNFAITEDPTNYPATVLVYLDGADVLGASAEGRAYLAGDVAAPSSNGMLTLPAPAFSIGGLHLAPTTVWARFFNTLPSQVTAGDEKAPLPAPFAYSGTESSVTQYPLGPGLTAPQLAGPGYYTLPVPLTPQAVFRAAARLLVPQSANVSASDGRGLSVRVRTTAATFGLGCVAAQSGGVALGLCDARNSGGSFVAGTPGSLAYGQAAEVAVALDGQGQVTLSINGRVVQRATAAAAGFAATDTSPGMDFGSFNGSACNAVFEAAGISASDPTDYNSVYGTANVQAADTLALSFTPQASDVGRAIRVISGGGAAASQGQARGTYPIISVNPSQSTVTVGPTDLGTVSVQASTLSYSGAAYPLVYPDDLGRQITLAGSTLGNNGTYTVSAILNEDGSQALSRPAGSPQVASKFCTLSPAPQQSETGLDASLLPGFSSGAARVQLVGTYTTAGLGGIPSQFSPRAPLPFDPASYTVTSSQVLSAQVFDDLGPVNHVVSPGPPPTFVIWPLYLVDPTSFVETYLQDMLAAGVQLKVMVGLEGSV